MTVPAGTPLTVAWMGESRVRLFVVGFVATVGIEFLRRAGAVVAKAG